MIFLNKAEAENTNLSGESWVELLNLDTVGDYGGGTYYPVASEPSHLGKFQSADGTWWELVTSEPNISQFGARSHTSDMYANDNTLALKSALQYCKDKEVYQLKAFGGTYAINDTIIIPSGVTLRGQGNTDVEDNNSRGTKFRTYAASRPAGGLWTDVDGNDPTDYAPFFVLGGSEAQLVDLTIENNTGGTAAKWDCGIFLPCVQRCRIINVDVRGKFLDAGIRVDATWSSLNTTLMSAQPDVTPAIGMNDLHVEDCRIIAGRWAIKYKGTDRAGSTDPFVWSPGGVSDHMWINCRISNNALDTQTSLVDSGCLHIDLRGEGNYIGQGQYFTRCHFRSQGIYMVYLDKARRVQFTDCYGEATSGWYNSVGQVKTKIYSTANTSHVYHQGDSMFNNSVENDWNGAGNQTVIEYDGTGVSSIGNVIKTTATIDFPSLAPHSHSWGTGDITMIGAEVGDIVDVEFNGLVGNNLLDLKAYVKSADTVRIVMINNSDTQTLDPASRDFNLRIIK